MQQQQFFCLFVPLRRYVECGQLEKLGAAAVDQLQDVCTLTLARSYADGVQPFPWNPTWLEKAAPKPAVVTTAPNDALAYAAAASAPAVAPVVAATAVGNGSSSSNGNGGGEDGMPPKHTRTVWDKVQSTSGRFTAEQADALAAAEAAWKIELNRDAILEDIVRKSGLARPTADAYGATYQSFNGNKPKISPAVIEAVDLQLRRVCMLLLTGRPGPQAMSPEAAAVGSAALAFFRNRASAPRDVSAAAAEKLRAACDEALRTIYSA